MQTTQSSPLAHRIRGILRNDLDIDPPDDETDLIESGVLTSLMFVQLLLRLEQDFEIKIDLETVELDVFRSIASMACFLAAMNGSADTSDKREHVESCH